MMGDHDDYQSEPIRGLPERPPAGEHILWQGSPSWWQLCKEVFHIRLVGAYLLGLMAWRAHTRMLSGGDFHVAAASILALLPFAAIGVGLLAIGLTPWMVAAAGVAAAVGINKFELE